MDKIRIANGSEILLVPSDNNIRGKIRTISASSIHPSMWCPECEIWTKDYEANGYHVCGSEVTTGSLDSGFPDIDYKGEAIR